MKKKNKLGNKNQFYKIKINYILIFLLILVLLLNIVNGVPIPQGIDGIIYELDRITEVPKGTDFYVENLNNGEKIYGKTGHGSNGRYSVSLSGDYDDIIIVKAWNDYNQVNETIPLQGVIHNFNLFLNMTFPQIAPKITSEPVLDAVTNNEYYYDVEAYDENGDVLSYLLHEYPDGMEINESTGLIYWLPKRDHIGDNNVSVGVSDGVLSDNQSFVILVVDGNSKPVINSTPVTEAKVNQLYKYDVDAYDVDNDSLRYYLTQWPRRMVINRHTGFIKWRPRPWQIGNNTVVVGVSDGISNDSQEFVINVLSEHPRDISQKVTNDVPTSISYSGTLDYNEESETILLSQRPLEVGRISKIVYKYLNIKKQDVGSEIGFKVELTWLNRYDIKEEDIILNEFSKNQWKELETTYVREDDKFAYFVSKSTENVYYAITVKDGVYVKNVEKPSVSKINIQFRLSGIFYLFNREQIKRNTSIYFENIESSKRYKSETGIGPYDGGYFVSIVGNKGDRIRINIEGVEGDYEILLDDIKNLDFVINKDKDGFVKLTDLTISKEINRISQISIFLLLILVIIFIRFKYKKDV